MLGVGRGVSVIEEGCDLIILERVRGGEIEKRAV